MEGDRGKTGKRKRVDDVGTDELQKEFPAGWWKKLGEDLQMDILRWLPAEYVCRYRKVCHAWNIMLSSNHFITHKWADASINKQPWLVLCDLLPNNPCMAFCFYTQTWKPCFSLCFPDEERDIKLKCRGSAAGFVLVDRWRDNLGLWVCNPYTGNSIQLPPMSAITRLLLKCIGGDNNNTDNGAYEVVAIGFNDDRECIMEKYDCSQQIWNVFGPIPEHTDLFPFGDFVYCDGSYYCIMSRTPWSVFGFIIPKRNEAPEPLMLTVPIPEIMLTKLLELQLVVCRSRLLVVAPIEEVVFIWELESENKQRHPLSTNNNTATCTWNEITRMPPSLWEDFKPKISDPRYKCTGVGDNVCFTRVEGMHIKVAVYNLSTRSWSRLPSCPWRNNWSFIHLLGGSPAMAFQPRLDT